MSRFFRFSVRDLLWLTLVVAVLLGWLVQERQLRAVIREEHSQAERWRGAAGGMQDALATDGWTTVWNWQLSRVDLAKRAPSDPRGWHALSAAFCEPKTKYQWPRSQ